MKLRLQPIKSGLVVTLLILASGVSADALWADSPKRGLGMPLRAEVQQRNLDRLAELSPAWFYSWGPSPASGFAALPAGIDYVPMSWGRLSPSVHQQSWIDGKQAGLYDTLLGFNEPDLASQSNISVNDALDLWPTLEATGLRLGSPATANTSNGWFHGFMQGVNDRGLRVDFIAMHIYSDDNVQNFLNRVDSLHQQYDLPVWITEFGVRDPNASSPANNRFTDQRVYDFMAAVLPELEARDYVERYAWFPAERGNRFLTHSALHEDNGQLTALGRLYQGLTAARIVGDYNGDGFVSHADLDLVLLNWGDNAAPAGFDETNLVGGGPFDGLIGQNELDGVLLNWGNGVIPSVTAIPEPGSAALLAFLALGGVSRGCRKQR